MTDAGLLHNAYDQVPYRSLPFPQSHPDRLATIATLFGMSPTPLRQARILELGCSSGGNLLPIADQFSQSHCLGIDASARQIGLGNDVLQSSQLKNAELRQQGIEALQNDKPFDYIVCHGVYSWVPDSVQDAILDVVQKHLAPNGVAYISYNTYPGWHMRAMIRDVMLFRAKFFDSPEEKLEQARGLLTFLTNSIKSENNAYGMMLRNELESISRSEDYYLMHDHLEEINEPIYFHDFAERLAQKELQYVGEADFGVMSLDNFPENVRGMLQSVSRNRVELEQYMDFLRNRAFRQTLITHRSTSLSPNADERRMINLRIASNAAAETEQFDPRSNDQVSFRRKGSVLTTSDPVVKAAMLHLRKVWPHSVPFTELAATARSFVAGRPVPVDSEILSDASLQLARTLLRCFATSMIDLHVEQPTFTTQVSNTPETAPLARVQAARESAVTNRLHEYTPLDDIQRFVLRKLDGRTDMAALTDLVAQAAETGELLLFHPDGRRVEETQDVRSVLRDMLPQVVLSLARRALLVR